MAPRFVLSLGYAIARVLREPEHHPIIVIGKDTRSSNYVLEAALQAGCMAGGAEVFLTGPLPTPGIAYMVRTVRASAGIVISASHNLAEDNGIKIFGADGYKLPDAVEERIEAVINEPIETRNEDISRALRIEDARGRYIEFLKGTLGVKTSFRGMRIAVDAANGAAHKVAPQVFEELRATVFSTGVDPNGLNINFECGATHKEHIAKFTKDTRADVGIALDGDADRLIMCDKDGKTYDGDMLLYIAAVHGKQTGVVGTIMANMGVEQAFRERGIEFLRTQVGDRYVLERMLEKGLRMGGEASGHLILLDLHTTGDGLLSALHVLKIMQETGKTLGELTKDITLFAESSGKVKLTRKVVEADLAALKTIQVHAEESLGSNGRVIMRASGTEPAYRIHVEHESPATASAVKAQIKKQVEQHFQSN